MEDRKLKKKPQLPKQILYKNLILVAVCGVILTLGCDEENPLIESDTLQTPYTVLVDEKIEVSPETYQAWEFSFFDGDSLHGEIASEPEVNILLLSHREFEAYENREPFRVYAAASQMRTRTFTFSYTIPESGKYHFVVGNVGSVFTSKAVSVHLALTQ